MENSHIREDTSMNESSLYNHRVLFKKQKSHSTVFGEGIPDNQIIRHKNSSLSGKAFNLKRVDAKTSNQSENERKLLTNEKASMSNELYAQAGYHKKNESLDKNMLAKNKNAKGNKFFLNTSLKMFHFKSGSRQLDSVSKRSPSFSNSNLPTDLPSNKVGSTTSSSRPILSTQKILIGSKERAVSVRPIQQNLFEDLKAYTQYKASMCHHSKFITNLKYPFYFDDHLDNTEPEESRFEFFDASIFEKVNTKSNSKWKEDIKKKLEAKKNKNKSSHIDG